MASVIYGICHLWQTYNCKRDYGKKLYSKHIIKLNVSSGEGTATKQCKKSHSWADKDLEWYCLLIDVYLCSLNKFFRSLKICSYSPTFPISSWLFLPPLFLSPYLSFFLSPLTYIYSPTFSYPPTFPFSDTPPPISIPPYLFRSPILFLLFSFSLLFLFPPTFFLSPDFFIRLIIRINSLPTKH